MTLKSTLRPLSITLASSVSVRATVSFPRHLLSHSADSVHFRIDMNIADYAKSALYIAQYHYLHGGGNLSLAQKYLEQLSASNSEDVNAAQELLKQVMAAIQVKESQAKAKGTDAGTEVEDVSMES